MKKLTQITALLTAVLLLTALLAGCGTKDQSPSTDTTDTNSTSNTEDTSSTQATPEPADDSGAPETDAAPSGTEAAPSTEGAHISPVPSGFDPMDLEDCMFQVSFTNDDIELNNEGAFVLHLTVWEQELFDMVDVAMLKEGDTITVCGKDVTVDSVERTDEAVHINGGEEAGGVTLVPDEAGGTFHESIAEVSEYDAVYTSVAQLTLPVDGDSFVYTDNSDPEGEAETYFAGDLLTMKDEVDFSCTALNGTAHIVNNQVTEITRIYTP